MEIRSITYFDHPGTPLQDAFLSRAGRLIEEAVPLLEKAGYTIQSTRFASPPFPELLPDCRPGTVIPFARQLGEECGRLGFSYTAIGPALPGFPDSYGVIPALIAQTENVFASAVMSDRKTGLSLSAVRACAEIIHALADVDRDGFANLYFAALANVPPGAPFFPAAYHTEQEPVFAFAVEGADLAVEAFTQAPTLAAARAELILSLEEHARRLTAAARTLENNHPARFGGIDYSLAPFPEQKRSLGTALERLGVPVLGNHGSLAAASFLADTIDRADFPRCGFSGLMLPVLEDATLAARAAQGVLSVKDLLLYSAVCGTGLDTIPLPGDISVDALNALLLDLAALAVRLDKPLTARLMPIPGKQAGDQTAFDFAYFANSRVMAVDAQKLTGKIGGEETFSLKPRG